MSHVLRMRWPIWLGLVGILSCGSGVGMQDVTGDSKSVGTYKVGQIYALRKRIFVRKNPEGHLLLEQSAIVPEAVVCELEVGQRLKVGRAFQISGMNYCYVDVFATIAGSTIKDEVRMRGISLRTGNQNADGEVIAGPDPTLLDLVP